MTVMLGMMFITFSAMGQMTKASVEVFFPGRRTLHFGTMGLDRDEKRGADVVVRNSGS